MTTVTVQVADNSKLPLLIATLKRLASSGGLEFAIEQGGQAASLNVAANTLNDDTQFEATVNKIVADAIAGKLDPLTEEEGRQTSEYWETVGAELNLTDDEIVRLIKEDRAEHQAKSEA